MVVLRRKPLQMEMGDDRSYELQIGWPSWDPTGQHGELSVRIEIRDASGRYLRSSPEFPVSWLPHINEFVKESRQLGLAVGAAVPS